MDFKAIIYAILGLVVTVIYNFIIGWDPAFPIDGASFLQLVQFIFGHILNVAGVGIAGAMYYRLQLQGKLGKSKTTPVKVGLKNVKEI